MVGYSQIIARITELYLFIYLLFIIIIVIFWEKIYNLIWNVEKQIKKMSFELEKLTTFSTSGGGILFFILEVFSWWGLEGPTVYVGIVAG